MLRVGDLLEIPGLKVRYFVVDDIFDVDGITVYDCMFFWDFSDMWSTRRNKVPFTQEDLESRSAKKIDV